jgi:tetratricopeptide (TPR) repeat protein
MKDNYRFVLLLPVVVFGTGVWLYFQTENEVRVQMAWAQSKWRQGAYEEAIRLYESVSTLYPESRYADDALWEAATIYYYNYYDVNRSLSCFQRLVTRYPGTYLARESHLKLAEINEVALRDPASAVAHWKQALLGDGSIRSRRGTNFKLGDAYLKLDEFEEAERHFALVLNDGIRDHLTDQTGIRIGTILQIRRDYRESLEYFHHTLRFTECDDCSLRAKLGLIESYEFMDDLPKALEIAESIKATEYPEHLKQTLVKRLTDKNRYYGQKLWNR